MNDLEFYKYCVSDPNSPDHALKQAIGSDPHRQQTHQNCVDFDDELREAMQLEIPHSLETQLIDSRENTQKLFNAKKIAAIAASLLFVIIITIATFNQMKARDVGEDMMDHVFTEIDKLHTYTSPVSNLREKVNATLPQLGITARSPISHLHYAGTCKIGNENGFHLIVKGKKGLVTVLYSAAEVDPKSLARGGMQGMLFPSLKGSMGIIGNMGEDLEAIRQELEEKLILEHPQT